VSRTHSLVVIATVACLCLPLLVLVHIASAQSSEGVDEFSFLRASVTGSHVFRYQGMESWSPDPGARLSVSSPYGIGLLRLDGEYRGWQPEGDLPSVRTISILAGWGLASDRDGSIELNAGLMAGNTFMLMDLPKGAPGRFESEILAVSFVRLGRRISSSLRVFLELRAQRVFTRPRWELIDSSAGVSIDMNTPRWIQRILQ